MRGPTAFVQHLESQQYHPRSDAHSNAICQGILDDLLDQCRPFAVRAQKGEIVARLNHTVTVGFENWNIDLAVGPPPGAPVPPGEDSRITFAIPTAIEVAIEAKGVMTEHGKARRNRLRDLHAFHAHAHQYNLNVIAAGVVVVNLAEYFWSPMREESDISHHRGIERLATETINLFRNIPLRNSAQDGAGMEAMCLLVVKHDNLRKNPRLPKTAPDPAPATLVTKTPAPQEGDPMHYATMLHRLCSQYAVRFG